LPNNTASAGPRFTSWLPPDPLAKHKKAGEPIKATEEGSATQWVDSTVQGWWTWPDFNPLRWAQLTYFNFRPEHSAASHSRQAQAKIKERIQNTLKQKNKWPEHNPSPIPGVIRSNQTCRIKVSCSRVGTPVFPITPISRPKQTRLETT
jgi:hypothetical protein